MVGEGSVDFASLQPILSQLAIVVALAAATQWLSGYCTNRLTYETVRDMEERTLTCIRCPRGCAVTVTLEDGAVVSVRGNSCPRGDAYARAEVTNPTRVVTTTVPVRGSDTERMRLDAAPFVRGEEVR